MKLNKQKERILKVLVDPQIPLTGLDTRFLGAKAGYRPSMGVMYDVHELFDSSFVSKQDDKWIIAQKGREYVESHKPMRNFQKLFSAKILVPLIISIVAGLIAAAIIGAFGD